MGLLEEVEAAQAQKKRRRICSVATLLDTMGADDREDLVTVMDNESYPSVTITHVLRSRGFTVDDRHMQDHRGGRCACSR